MECAGVRMVAEHLTMNLRTPEWAVTSPEWAVTGPEWPVKSQQ